jgi:hypothetical protein
MVSNEMAFNLLCGEILPSSAQIDITGSKIIYQLIYWQAF